MLREDKAMVRQIGNVDGEIFHNNIVGGLQAQL